MMIEPRQHVRGEVVEHVDLETLFGPREVPVMPARWYLLRVHPGREFKVMKTFRQRNVSAWLPLHTRRQNVTKYRRGYEITVQQQVTSPLTTGVLLLPDFEVRAYRWDVDGVIGIHRVGDGDRMCVPVLTPHDIADLRNIEAVGNTPKSKRDRKFALGELVRVTNGPFALFAGRVERFDSPGRLSVGIDIFGRVTPIHIDESDLETV